MAKQAHRNSYMWNGFTMFYHNVNGSGLGILYENVNLSGLGKRHNFIPLYHIVDSPSKLVALVQALVFSMVLTVVFTMRPDSFTFVCVTTVSYWVVT